MNGRSMLRDRSIAALLTAEVVISGFGNWMTYLALPWFVRAFYAATGIGAVLGSVVAYRASGRFRPLRLAAAANAGSVLPRWLLGLWLPAPGVVGALAASSFWNPIGNAPMLGLMTTRTPAALRAKVMTALVAFVVLARPFGLAVGGPLAEAVGPRPFFLITAAGMTLSTAYFVFIALRADSAELSAAVAT